MKAQTELKDPQLDFTGFLEDRDCMVFNMFYVDDTWFPRNQ